MSSSQYDRTQCERHSCTCLCLPQHATSSARIAPADMLYSAINGILAMDAFIKQFNTGYIDESSQTSAFSPAQTAIIVAILSAGTAIGALIAAPAADIIGRRLSLLASVGVFCFGVIFQVCADAIPMLLVGRYVEKE